MNIRKANLDARFGLPPAEKPTAGQTDKSPKRQNAKTPKNARGAWRTIRIPEALYEKAREAQARIRREEGTFLPLGEVLRRLAR